MTDSGYTRIQGSGASWIYYIEETDSTMEDARILSQKNAPHGSCVFTGFQRKGRGRLAQRKWETPPGNALLFTQMLYTNDLSFSPPLAPLWCGLILLRTLEKELGMKGEIKWPNDILIGGKKLSGILCQNTGDIIYAGIGINLLQKEFPKDLRRPATSILLETGQKISPLELLTSFLENQRIWKDFHPTELNSYLYMFNRPVLFNLGLEEDRVIKGILKGVNQEGSLLLQTSEGIKSFVSGELVTSE